MLAGLEELAARLRIVRALKESEEADLIVVLSVVRMINQDCQSPNYVTIRLRKQCLDVRRFKERMFTPAKKLSLMGEYRRDPMGIS
ncbi:MAG: hypothetical protein KF805_03010 [Phycisphaeraceae bacterium]|nr:hypothetical protein [Phycisphaeraceae bacterium]